MLWLVVFSTGWTKQIRSAWFMNLSVSCQVVVASKGFTTAFTEMFICFYISLSVTPKIRLRWIRVPTYITYMLDRLRHVFYVVNKTSIHFTLKKIIIRNMLIAFNLSYELFTDIFNKLLTESKMYVLWENLLKLKKSQGPPSPHDLRTPPPPYVT